MASIVNLVTDAAGDAGAGGWVVNNMGPVVIELTDSSDLTGVSIGIDFSPDGAGASSVRLVTEASPTNGMNLFNGFLPSGAIREVITGGGAGDNIDIDMYTGSAAQEATVLTVDTVVDAILVDTGTTLDNKINTLVTESDTNNTIIKMLLNQVSSLLHNLNKLTK